MNPTQEFSSCMTVVYSNALNSFYNFPLEIFDGISVWTAKKVKKIIIIRDY